MKTKYLLLIALPLVALCACNKENVDTNETRPVSIFASHENDDTKTALDGINMTWAGGEDLRLGLLDNTLATGASAQQFTFSNVSGPGTSASFECESFKAEGFLDGEQYIVVSKQNDQNVSRQSGHWLSSLYINSNQTYNGTNAIGLSDNVIPVYGEIKVGDPSYSKDAINMKTPCTVLKLVLTNSTGSAQTISKITLTTSLTGERNGMAGKLCMRWYSPFTPGTFRPDAGANRFFASGGLKTITLNCGNITLGNGVTKVFSFVVAGDYNLETLTWRVYDNSEPAVQIGSDITSTPGKKLLVNTIYTKTASL